MALNFNENDFLLLYIFSTNCTINNYSGMIIFRCLIYYNFRLLTAIIWENRYYREVVLI
jgi:hypothetical protein